MTDHLPEKPEHENTVQPEGAPIVDQDALNLGILNWLGTVVLGFIPGLLLYFIKQDDEFVKQHSKEALNWSITVFILTTVASLTTVILIGFLLLPLVGLVHFVFCVMGMMAASKGKAFYTPFCIRLLK